MPIGMWAPERVHHPDQRSETDALVPELGQNMRIFLRITRSTVRQKALSIKQFVILQATLVHFSNCNTSASDQADTGCIARFFDFQVHTNPDSIFFLEEI